MQWNGIICEGVFMTSTSRIPQLVFHPVLVRLPRAYVLVRSTVILRRCDHSICQPPNPSLLSSPSWGSTTRGNLALLHSLTSEATLEVLFFWKNSPRSFDLQTYRDKYR